MSENITSANTAFEAELPRSSEQGQGQEQPKTPPAQVFVIGHISDFPEGSHRVVKVGRREIGIFHIKGQFYGLPNTCPHQTGPLCEGKRLTGTLFASKETDWQPRWIHDGEIIMCPWHGLEYHVPTGQCLAKREFQLRRYHVFVEQGEIKVCL